MLDDSFFARLKKVYENADGDSAAYDEELPTLREALAEVERELQGAYEFVAPFARGGAGVLVRIRDKRLNALRALKLPRPRGEEILESVKRETATLVDVRHESIIAIHALGEVKVRGLSYPFFVMDYIEGAKDLRQRLPEFAKAQTTSRDVAAVTDWLALRVLEVARALAYLHDQQIIHFDVKPTNVLIDPKDRAILGDLGYAKKWTASPEPVVVGFTLAYAHPTLRAHYIHGSSQNRIRKQVAPQHFKTVWDIFAFGKSLLECLALISGEYPDVITYDTTFMYLHLAACRMLDGLNLSDLDVKHLRAQQAVGGPLAYEETWMELGREEFVAGKLAYASMLDVVVDLEKLRGVSPFQREIPEIEVHYPHRIQTSSGSPAPFTHRVRRLIEHPVFARLERVSQLGFVRQIYPTAHHTRFDHSIGVFRNCCLYVQALLNDSFNPFFRQVVTSGDLKALLIASLLHDLGQFPFAHDLEEVVPGLSHRDFTVRFLQNPAVDSHGNTISQIIENKDWGWGVDLCTVIDLIKGERTQAGLFHTDNHKARMLSSIIDGPIDADKLDYLIRDSHECFLGYGALIDFDRLVRNLTIIISRDNDKKCRISLGAYEKGQSACEAVAFARYLLYQAVYWHHSARSARAMLCEAAARAVRRPDEHADGPESEPASPQIERTMSRGGRASGRGKKGEPKGQLLPTRPALREVIADLLGVDQKPRPIEMEDVLKMLKEQTDELGGRLIDLIRDRRFYKRILTIHYETPQSRGVERRVERFRNRIKDPGFRAGLRERIVEKFTQVVASGSRPERSVLSSDNVGAVAEILKEPTSILFDCPEPSFGGMDCVWTMPEPQTLSRTYGERMKAGVRMSDVWKEVFFPLMHMAAKGRVFCHPDVRDALMAALTPEQIMELVNADSK